MLAFGRVLATSTRKVTCQLATKRLASTTSTFQSSTHNVMPLFNYTPLNENTSVSVASVSEHISRLRPFSAPPAPQPQITTPVNKAVEELELTSVLRKRRLKMNKHKHKKLRKRTRALRKKLGK